MGQDIGDPALHEQPLELNVVSVEAVGDDGTERDAGGARLLDESDGDLRLGAKARILRASGEARDQRVGSDVQGIVHSPVGPEGGDGDDAIVDLADRAEIVPADMRRGGAVLPTAGVVEHQHAAAMGRSSRLALQQRKAPGVERLGAPVGLRKKVLQALDRRALRLHQRFRASQRRERLVAIARSQQPAQIMTKAAALAERTEQRVKRRREPLQRSRGRRARLTGGHRHDPPMISTHRPNPSLTNYR
jgi:hypothetical protein